MEAALEEVCEDSDIQSLSNTVMLHLDIFDDYIFIDLHYTAV
jgi:hypothetical protein